MGAPASRIGLALLTVGLGACRAEPAPGPAVRSFVLPAPELSEPAFEPHLAIDPANPDRIVVAAHYGIGYNRGGRRIWTWRTSDGGRTWIGADQPLPNEEAALAADAVVAFGTDGTAYLSFLFADTTGKSFDGGDAWATMAPDEQGFGPAHTVVRGGLNLVGAAVDKDWLAVDRGPASPLRGTAYLSWHLNKPDLTRGTAESTFWLASTRDDGQTFSEPVKVANAFSGQIAVRSDGTVDVIFGSRQSNRILHAQSTDGGRSFETPDTVVSLAAGRFDVPTLVAGPADTLFVCWSETVAADSLRYDVRCSRSPDGHRWDPPTPLILDLPTSSSVGFPAAVATPDGLWVMAYRADTDTTRVILYLSGDGGRSFTPSRELATRPFGAAAFCPAAGAPCRKAPEGRYFFGGDYFGLGAAPGRLAAAYVLPDGDTEDGRPSVYVSVIDLGAGR